MSTYMYIYMYTPPTHPPPRRKKKTAFILCACICFTCSQLKKKEGGIFHLLSAQECTTWGNLDLYSIIIFPISVNTRKSYFGRSEWLNVYKSPISIIIHRCGVRCWCIGLFMLSTSHRESWEVIFRLRRLWTVAVYICSVCLFCVI